MTASRQLKQLQWDKINQTQLSKTVWGKSTLDENEVARLLQTDGVFDEMEEDFKAKKLVLNLDGQIITLPDIFDLAYLSFSTAAKREKKELISVLDPRSRHRIGVCFRISTQRTGT